LAETSDLTGGIHVDQITSDRTSRQSSPAGEVKPPFYLNEA